MANVKYVSLDKMIEKGYGDKFINDGRHIYNINNIIIKQERCMDNKLRWSVIKNNILLGNGLSKKDAALMVQAILEGKNFWEYK